MYAHVEYLAQTDWLEPRLGDPALCIFDVTAMLTSTFENLARARCHDLGHIPGAQFLDVASGKGVISNPDAPLPWTWPTPGQFERAMSDAGVANDSTVILYAATPRKGIDQGLMWATRAWWVMHHFGVNCRVLNGGWEKWVAEGRAVSTEGVSRPATSFRAAPGWERAVASKDDVLQAIGPGGAACVVDALSQASFAGTDRARYGARKGHISGAVNVPMSRLVDPSTGVFLPPEQIRASFEQAGVEWSGPVITYCGGAIAATVNAFALALCGHERVAVYDGSLMEWSNDPSLPMTDPSALA